MFPQAIALAATFDESFVQKVAAAIADEARAKYNEAIKAGNQGQYWGLTFWTPNINIFRDPRWGRGQETYGEDPLLTGRIGLAFMKGLQGDNPERLKVAACAKHFAVHSGPENQRHTFDAKVSKKDLFETYLPAFKLLVENGVEAVMGAYNRTLGEPCCGSTYLLQDILRGQWQFKGHVVSDCWAIRDFHENHRVTASPEASAAKALNATNPIASLRDFDRRFIPAGKKLLFYFELPASAFETIDEEGASVLVPGSYKIIVADAAPLPVAMEKGACIPMSKNITVR